ncbi:hypothetical protein BKA83DRAFT_344382 [Pisolithus microcarpus]|nr:hypothetical protein BKA83DRAFT_344382 [Pisolithus microcarpus]
MNSLIILIISVISWSRNETSELKEKQVHSCISGSSSYQGATTGLNIEFSLSEGLVRLVNGSFSHHQFIAPAGSHFASTNECCGFSEIVTHPSQLQMWEASDRRSGKLIIPVHGKQCKYVWIGAPHLRPLTSTGKTHIFLYEPCCGQSPSGISSLKTQAHHRQRQLSA